jgi:hypothetical protein
MALILARSIIPFTIGNHPVGFDSIDGAYYGGIHDYATAAPQVYDENYYGGVGPRPPAHATWSTTSPDDITYPVGASRSSVVTQTISHANHQERYMHQAGVEGDSESDLEDHSVEPAMRCCRLNCERMSHIGQLATNQHLFHDKGETGQVNDFIRFDQQSSGFAGGALTNIPTTQQSLSQTLTQHDRSDNPHWAPHYRGLASGSGSSMLDARPLEVDMVESYNRVELTGNVQHQGPALGMFIYTGDTSNGR